MRAHHCLRLLPITLIVWLSACSETNQTTDESKAQSAESRVDGKVRIAGSSTVFPISEAVAEEFSAVQPRVRVTVGVSGTGGGFKKFLAGEIDINDASRPIKESELEIAQSSLSIIHIGRCRRSTLCTSRW